MNIYSISDLHLSLCRKKPMDIFGDEWINHVEKIRKNWQLLVGNEDVVIIAGDISWAINLKEAERDLRFIENLNGIKILLRGNHDYWWPSSKKFIDFLSVNKFNSINFIKNNFIELEKYLICGTRGWEIPNDDSTESDHKIYKRELIRLENSINLAKKQRDNKDIILMLHYPPFDKNNKDSGFIKIIEKYSIEKIIYGHIHGNNIEEFRKIKFDKFETFLTSADSIGFKPIKIA
ncbi:MAG: metallophosphoesterase [Clostridiales bacterium]